MTTAQTNDPSPRKPLRLWPGVLIAVLQLMGMFVVPLFIPDGAAIAVMSGFFGGVLVFLWWLFFSRAPWADRLGALVLVIVALFATRALVHASIAGGMMGMMPVVYTVPLISLAFVAWAVLSRRLSRGAQRVSMAAAILLACGAMTLVRTDGLSGDANSDIRWRWTPTHEEQLLAQADEPEPLPPAPAPADTAPPATPGTPLPPQAGDAPTTPAAPTLAAASTPASATAPVSPPAAAAPETPAPAKAGGDAATPSAGAAAATATAAPMRFTARAEWPGFRGPERDGVVRGARIETDWTRTPPVEMWRRPIGPGWSSFAVDGDLLFTQEQRGDDEVVSAYRVKTGEPVWRHRNATRFYESNAGAGPRGTPTVVNGRVYTVGATGVVNALNAGDGSVIWTRNVGTDTKTEIPGWGFASSPLVVGDVVITAAASALAAYDLTTGKPRWYGPTDGWGYSSPHLKTIGGVTQVVFLNGTGAIGIAPADGTVLWKHEWPGDGIVQPAFASNGDLLIGSGTGMGKAAGIGIRRVSIAQGSSGGWTAQERWTTNSLKPYYNDFVVHENHAFGFDGSILACIDLSDGTRKWKGGRYGHGQLVVLPEQDVLLVLSEEGELALVSATPDKFTEIARAPALEGKTWNHPVLVGDTLLVRNDHEMAAFRLPPANR